MAANNDPIYSRLADIQWASSNYLVASNTDSLMATGTVYQLFTADATNGGYVQKVRLKAALNATTTATVFRLYVNNGSTTSTAANNALVDEITLPATASTATAATATYEIPCNFALPAGYKLYGTLGTASAAGWQATVFGGKY